ncbi:MAG: UvrD-helicase domain-containing protein [Thermodesulfobacteriota bacterium]
MTKVITPPMDFLADLHIHSPYSRGTSPTGDLAALFAWARVKGITVLGTGDFTHPAWFRHLQEELVPAEPGLFRLRDEGKVPPALVGVSPAPTAVRFLLSAEISSIYKRDGRVRKVHNLLFVPDLAAAAAVNARLAAVGNIEADGRPILGLDSRHLLEILLECAPAGFLVPAHIWTPWFSILGSKSGFDGIEECFGDLSPQVFALETGLSSDPEMNRLVSSLDRFTLISNSDAHSPAKLGREANRFRTALDYFAMREALRQPALGFAGTVEFFPEEGKYHLDGHRACGVVTGPEETRRSKGRCPVCGRPLTVGVLHRVRELADRQAPPAAAGPGWESLVPLPEILAELLDKGAASKAVLSWYGSLINRFGSEFRLLREVPLSDLEAVSPPLAEAIRRLRAGQVHRQAGYDGTYGVIRLFAPGERHEIAGQKALFRSAPRKAASAGAPVSRQPLARSTVGEDPPSPALPTSGPNPEQEQAIRSEARLLVVIAGPGTGKTYTLVSRLQHLLAQGLDPASLAAITFTNRAADEIRTRLAKGSADAAQVFVGTFHAFCLKGLRAETPGLTVVGDEERQLLLAALFPELSGAKRSLLAEAVAAHSQALATGEPEPPPEVARYLALLDQRQALDLEAVIPAWLERCRKDPAFRQRVVAPVRHLLVDEIQDLSESQYALVELVAAQASVFAIGDPDQAIYGFRGARPEFLFRFRDEQGAQVLPLATNYRSTTTILTAAGAVIRHNPGGGQVRLQARRRDLGGGIELAAFPQPTAEAAWVAQRVEALLGGTSHRSLERRQGSAGDREHGLGDIAILYRLQAAALTVAEALHQAGIPFQLVGAPPFFLQDGLAPAAALVQAAAGGAAEALLLAAAWPGLGRSAAETLARLPEAKRPSLAAMAGLPGLTAAQGRALAQLTATIEVFAAAAPAGLAPALAPVLTALGLDPASGPGKRLVDLAAAFGGDLAALARHLAENRQATVYDPKAQTVAVMSLHAAKGLEFETVFLAGLEDNLLPCRLPGLTTDLEEERRLFYVGLTRARSALALTHAASRTLFGQTYAQAPSRFLAEIPSQLLTRVAAPSPRRPAGRQLRLF